MSDRAMHIAALLEISDRAGMRSIAAAACRALGATDDELALAQLWADSSCRCSELLREGGRVAPCPIHGLTGEPLSADVSPTQTHHQEADRA
jgi:hypothetical protein